ncbi:LysR family transcriptional regulator [Allopusillimonas soli]|uniref:LysR family transcriptional regulator n=1 Tax=Allopusillimonas soli TaxID=659016 RepID=A0A853F928_9BURK|nr:LysR family transcriptional regulator [Allopusillimonas soli]NYT36487.1 LysR family transcriptional regulator [Allopusillimonas soli]TEA74991.1 LysR family transcriptional regulator [Allopusillimonas soli]
MTPRQLRYFVEIAKSGNISVASAALRIAQPALSQHVASMEQELGVKLLVRHGKGVSLTAEGKRLVQRASSILDQMEALHSDVIAPPGRPRGPVRLCIARSMVDILAAPLYRSVQATYPDVRLLLSSALSSEARTLMEARQLDLALMPNAFELPNIVCQPLYEESFALFEAHTSIRRVAKTIAFANIGSRPLVAPDRDHDLRRMVERTAVAHNCPLNVCYEINDPALCMALVREGVASAILPENASFALRHNPQIAMRRIIKPRLSRVQSIVRPLDANGTDAAIQAVADILPMLVDALIRTGQLDGKLADTSLAQ